jgi:nitroimidazol reductase NimA-like FMN-containing flavoprotein (pyridoxamine 5'-phosphate oxidase superfamily)
MTDMTKTWSHGLLHDLPEDECVRLLDSRRVGRLAFVDDEGPAVVPVNYVSHQGAVLLSISPHSSIGRHIRGQVVGIEVDDIDEDTRSGWSVLVRGLATFVDYDDLPDRAEGLPEPWPDGVRSLHVRVTRRSVTGRRLLPG